MNYPSLTNSSALPLCARGRASGKGASKFAQNGGGPCFFPGDQGIAEQRGVSSRLSPPPNFARKLETFSGWLHRCGATEGQTLPSRGGALNVQFPLGMNPGMPVLTTGLSLTRVVIPLVISSMASSGRAETAKFSWM